MWIGRRRRGENKHYLVVIFHHGRERGKVKTFESVVFSHIFVQPMRSAREIKNLVDAAKKRGNGSKVAVSDLIDRPHHPDVHHLVASDHQPQSDRRHLRERGRSVTPGHSAAEVAIIGIPDSTRADAGGVEAEKETEGLVIRADESPLFSAKFWQK